MTTKKLYGLPYQFGNVNYNVSPCRLLPNFSVTPYILPFPNFNFSTIFRNFMPCYSTQLPFFSPNYTSQTPISNPITKSGTSTNSSIFSEQTNTNTPSVDSFSLSNSKNSVSVGNATTIKEYTNQNLSTNAGKLKNLKSFKDLTGRAEMCNPEVVDTLIDLTKIAEQNGCRVVVSSSFRTRAEQQHLCTTKGLYSNGGYAAAPGTSAHEFGQAIDFAIYKGNVQVNATCASTPAWVLDCLKKHNMTWGGYFNKRKEPWHFNTANAKSYRSKLSS